MKTEMLISCPECAAVYRLSADVLPRQSLGDRPQKMRCCQCATVFVVSLKAAEAEVGPGYEEFAVPEPKDEELDGDMTQLHIPSVPDGGLETDAETEQLCVDVFDYQKEPSGRIEVTKEEPQDPPPQLVENPREWTSENILSLSKFEVPTGAGGKKRKMLFVWIATGTLFVLAALFVVFLFSPDEEPPASSELSSPDDPAEPKGASAKARPEPSIDEALSVQVGQPRKLVSVGGDEILIVNGRVVNETDAKYTEVLLEARVIDEAGQTRFETKGPCGIVYKDARLHKRKKGRFSRMFKRRGRFVDCKIGPGRSKQYQLIFEDISSGFDESYRVEVLVARAQKQDEDTDQDAPGDTP